MPITIGQNIASLRAHGELSRTSARLRSVYERLSSGQRINHAADDAAGLSVGLSLNINARIKAQGIRNISDGISLTSIASGAFESLIGIVGRQSELAEQAANGTYSSQQRSAMDREFQSLAQEYTRILSTTSFNGINLFGSTSQTVSIQADRSQIDITLPGSSSIALGADPSTGDSSLIASWKFDETTGTLVADSTANGNNASLPNGGTHSVGQIGNGITLDGTNQYLTESSIPFSGSAVSVSFWMNESSYSTHGTIFESSVNFNGTTTGFGFFQSDPVTGGPNTLQLAVNGDNGYNIKVYTPPTPGWHQYTAVFDKSQGTAGEIQLFIDGTLQTATSQPYTADNTNSFGANPFYMFSRAGTTEFIAGSIDQVRLYNRALTSSDAQALFQESSSLSLSSQANARTALDTLTSLRATLSQNFGQLGASESRLAIASANLQAQHLAYITAAGRILDADMASDAASLVKEQILQQAGALVLSHANMEPALALKLLGN